MKKLLSIMLALVMILSMSTVAFADDNQNADDNQATGDIVYTPTTELHFKEIVKTYTSENNVVVNETLSFTSTPCENNPDYEVDGDGKVLDSVANLTVADLTVNSLNPGTLTVTIPILSQVGTYEWIIKENSGNIAGVTYSEDEVHVIVLVEYDNTQNALKVAQTSSYIKKNSDGNKTKTFTNTFASGSFTVEKDIYGNMARKDDAFEVIVTLTSTKPIGTKIKVAGNEVAPGAWKEQKDNQGNIIGYTYTDTFNYSKLTGTRAFTDIPTGVTVTVAETQTEANLKGYTHDGVYNGKIEWDDDNERIVTGEFNGLKVASDTNAKVVVLNHKTSSVETGIALDSMPYFLMLAVACMGLVVFFMKKRSTREY